MLPTAPSSETPLAKSYPWWNDTVFYEIFLRSFMDSDGDGIGDINGLISVLDYLNDGDPATTTGSGHHRYLADADQPFAQLSRL